jgi:hypothetical protein
MRPSREHALDARHSSFRHSLDQAALRQGLGGQQRTESFFATELAFFALIHPDALPQGDAGRWPARHGCAAGIKGPAEAGLGLSWKEGR